MIGLSHCAGQQVKVDLLSLRIIKGYTKTQCVLFTMLSAADVGLSSPDAMDILRPLFPILDDAWLLPAKVSHFKAYRCIYFQIHFLKLKLIYVQTFRFNF